MTQHGASINEDEVYADDDDSAAVGDDGNKDGDGGDTAGILDEVYGDVKDDL